MKDFKEFQRKHEYLVCVDSDGCVIDGMTVKHLTCFGPGIIEVYGLWGHQEELLEDWNRRNLYSLTRGINRFKGLALELAYSLEKGYLKQEIAELEGWVQTTKELSNPSLEARIAENKRTGRDTKALRKALEWSNWVNRKIASLPPEKKKAFSEAGASLVKAREYADVVVVSSANRGAVEDEWQYNRLMDTVDVLMTQEYGSKKDCLCRLLELGYEPDRLLMVGDAPGDIASAKEAGVLYYPIVPGEENNSWARFRNEILEKVVSGGFRKGRMEQYEQEYYKKLEGN